MNIQNYSKMHISCSLAIRILRNQINCKTYNKPGKEAVKGLIILLTGPSDAPSSPVNIHNARIDTLRLSQRQIYATSHSADSHIFHVAPMDAVSPAEEPTGQWRKAKAGKGAGHSVSDGTAETQFDEEPLKRHKEGNWDWDCGGKYLFLMKMDKEEIDWLSYYQVFVGNSHQKFEQRNLFPVGNDWRKRAVEKGEQENETKGKQKKPPKSHAEKGAEESERGRSLQLLKTFNLLKKTLFSSGWGNKNKEQQIIFFIHPKSEFVEVDFKILFSTFSNTKTYVMGRVLRF